VEGRHTTPAGVVHPNFDLIFYKHTTSLRSAENRCIHFKVISFEVGVSQLPNT